MATLGGCGTCRATRWEFNLTQGNVGVILVIFACSPRLQVLLLRFSAGSHGVPSPTDVSKPPTFQSQETIKM